MSLIAKYIKARCPHCEDGAIFSGLLSVHDNCPVCGLSFTENETADGPIFLVITLMGFVVCGLAVWVELAYKPSYWLHAALWTPFILITCPLLLRMSKATMIHYHYKLTQKGQL